MRERVRIPLPVVVEGKYDKMKLASIIDATIVTTAGFGIFNSREKMALIKRLAEYGGVVILTDSDGAGSLIRSHIKSALPPDKIYDLYIPRIEGKERRKSAPSKDGSLGVEGMHDELLWELFSDFARRMGFDGEPSGEYKTITKADMMALGLTGDGSREARDELASRLGLPPKMTPNAFLGALNILVTRDELFEMLGVEK
jgi:ribonuclease M5